MRLLFSDVHFHFGLYDSTTCSVYQFNGSYTLKVVGGGNSHDSIRRYSAEEIMRYNSFSDRFVCLFVCLPACLSVIQVVMAYNG